MDAGTNVSSSILHRYPLRLRLFDAADSRIPPTPVPSVTVTVQCDPVFGRPFPLPEP
jgi:hypothetical protein